MEKSFINLLIDFFHQYDKSILEQPDKFKALLLDFTKNGYKAEVRIFYQFLSYEQIIENKHRAINDVSELIVIAERFHKNTLYDKKTCETIVLAYAFFMGFISSEAFESNISCVQVIKYPKPRENEPMVHLQTSSEEFPHDGKVENEQNEPDLNSGIKDRFDDLGWVFLVGMVSLVIGAIFRGCS